MDYQGTWKTIRPARIGKARRLGPARTEARASVSNMGERLNQCEATDPIVCFENVGKELIPEGT
jgi:hypothetical protein